MPKRTLWQRLFPCRFQEPLCQNYWGGCRCGKSSKKVENRANDLATQTNAAIQAATALSPEEEQFRQQILAAFGGQLPTLQGRAGETGGQLFGEISPEAQQLAALLSQRLAAPPQIAFEDTFNPEFSLVRQAVAAAANQRGIVGSGLELENLGRAGVDLAIKQAGLRQQNALLNQNLIQGTISDMGNLVGQQAGLSSEAKNRLADYLAQGMTQSNLLKQRVAGGVQAGYENPYFGASIEALQNRVNSSYEKVKDLGKTAGTILQAAMMSQGSPAGAAYSIGQNIPTTYGSPGYQGQGYANPAYQSAYIPQQQQNSLASFLDKFRSGSSY